MQTIWGKSVLNSLEELVNPKRTALVVVDMQNDICHPAGYFAGIGKDLSAIEAAVKAMAALVDMARQADVLIVWIQMTVLSDARSESAAWLRRRTLPYREGLTAPEWTLAGTWGHDFVLPLTPRPNEPIVVKHRSSAFVGTQLDLILRSNQVDSLVIGGVVTQGCVESTVRDATFFDYYVVFVRDCVATFDRALHEASMTCQSTRCDFASSQDVIAEWMSSLARAAEPPK